MEDRNSPFYSNSDVNQTVGDDLTPDSVWSDVDPNTGLLGVVGQFLGSYLFGNSASLGNFVNEILGVSSQRREFQQQEKLIQEQRDYDAFGSQLDRITSTGVNPNLAVKSLLGGNMQNSAGAPSVPSSNGSAASGLQAMLNVLNPLLQLSEVSKNQAETENTNAQTEGLKIDNFYKPLEKHYGLKLLKENIESIKAKTNLDNKSANLLQQQFDFNNLVEPWMVQKLQGEALLISQQIETEIRNTRLTENNANVAANQINVQNSQIFANNTQGNLNIAYKKLVDEETNLTKEQTKIAKVQVHRERVAFAYEKYVRHGIPLSVGEVEYLDALRQKGYSARADEYVQNKIKLAGDIRQAELDQNRKWKNLWPQMLIGGTQSAVSNLTPNLIMPVGSNIGRNVVTGFMRAIPK